MYEENNIHAFVSEHIDNTSKMFETADSISECDNMWIVMAWYFFLSFYFFKLTLLLLFYRCGWCVFFVAFAGNYKVEIFDKNINDFVPTVYGLGMHVEIRDPDDKVVLSRVSNLPADPWNDGCRLM